eukprot:592184-Rhodomonas_salina.1
MRHTFAMLLCTTCGVSHYAARSQLRHMLRRRPQLRQHAALDTDEGVCRVSGAAADLLGERRRRGRVGVGDAHGRRGGGGADRGAAARAVPPPARRALRQDGRPHRQVRRAPPLPGAWARRRGCSQEKG